MAKNVLKNPGRLLDTSANVPTAFASRDSKAVSSTLPEIIKIYNKGQALELEKFI